MGLGDALANWKCVCGRGMSIEHPFGGHCSGRLVIEDLQQKLERAESKNLSLRAALEKINKTGLDRSLGQIVGSEHYEKAWLDCVEEAGRALACAQTKKCCDAHNHKEGFCVKTEGRKGL